MPLPFLLAELAYLDQEELWDHLRTNEAVTMRAPPPTGGQPLPDKDSLADFVMDTKASQVMVSPAHSSYSS